jgi:hypothetical protein
MLAAVALPGAAAVVGAAALPRAAELPGAAVLLGGAALPGAATALLAPATLAPRLAGVSCGASVLAGGGGVEASGAWLPDGGNWPPLELSSRALVVVLLRAGLLPASFRAPAKSCVFA